MVLWNLLDGGLSRSGPLLGPFESMWGGTPGTNPRQAPVHPPLWSPPRSFNSSVPKSDRRLEWQSLSPRVWW
jgi:hypothetical protein